MQYGQLIEPARSLEDDEAYLQEVKQMKYLPTQQQIADGLVPFRARYRRDGDGPRQEPIEPKRTRHYRTKKATDE